MTEEGLRRRCGLEKGQLIDSSGGFADILTVGSEFVSVGILATGATVKVATDKFISIMSSTKPK